MCFLAFRCGFTCADLWQEEPLTVITHQAGGSTHGAVVPTCGCVQRASHLGLLLRHLAAAGRGAVGEHERFRLMCRACLLSRTPVGRSGNIIASRRVETQTGQAVNSWREAQGSEGSMAHRDRSFWPRQCFLPTHRSLFLMSCFPAPSSFLNLVSIPLFPSPPCLSPLPTPSYLLFLLGGSWVNQSNK